MMASGREFVRRSVRRGLRAAGNPLARFTGTVTNVEVQSPAVALTFDDGPDPDWTPRLLDLLASHEARATFFCTGRSATENPELVRRICEDGHEVGNHTWSHPSLPRVKGSQRRSEIRRAFEALAPFSSLRLFRPPFGSQSLASRLDALRSGLEVVAWDIDGQDWADHSAEAIADRIQRRLHPGAIILLHDRLACSPDPAYLDRSSTLKAVKILLARLQGEYEFVTVPELMRRGKTRRVHWYRRADVDWLNRLQANGGKTWRYSPSGARQVQFADPGARTREGRLAGRGIGAGSSRKPTTSVVVPCFNAEETLAEQLTALADQRWTGAWEAILVDNRSTDVSREIAESFRGVLPNLRILDGRERQGAAYAMNVGWKAARAPLVVICDADDVPGRDWLGAIVGALEEHPFVASHFEYERLNPPELLLSRGRVQEHGLQPGWYPPYLPHAGACGLGVRRELLERVGGFDEDLLLPDTDLCFRLELMGIDLQFVADAVMHVRFRSRLPSLFRQARAWSRENVKLCSRYGGGFPGLDHPWRRHFQEWEKVIARLSRLRSPSGRAYLTWRVGWLIGQFDGAIRYDTTPVPFNTRSPRTKGAA